MLLVIILVSGYKLRSINQSFGNKISGIYLSTLTKIQVFISRVVCVYFIWGVGDGAYCVLCAGSVDLVLYVGVGIDCAWHGMYDVDCVYAVDGIDCEWDGVGGA